MSQFQQPGIGGDKFEAANHNGHLLLFFPSAFRAQVQTSNGSADCVDTRIVDLDTGQVLDDAKVWGKAMVPQLKGAVPDGMVLGRLAQGQGKAGNNPPWILQPHTEQDVHLAERWLAANPRNQFGQPQQQAAPAPQAGGWGAPPTYAAQGGWGAPAPAPASPAPATGGWGNPPAAAPAQSQFEGQWGNAAPTAQPGPGAPSGPGAGSGSWGAPAPAAAPAIDPGLVAALQSRGVDPAQLQNQAHAEQIAAAMGLPRG